MDHFWPPFTTAFVQEPIQMTCGRGPLPFTSRATPSMRWSLIMDGTSGRVVGELRNSDNLVRLLLRSSFRKCELDRERSMWGASRRSSQSRSAGAVEVEDDL